MATKVEKSNFTNYLNEARSWETDKVKTLEKSRKVAWIIAISAGVLAFLSVIAVAMLTPLKTAVPYVIRVDNATGAVDIVTSQVDSKTNYDEIMNKYHIQWYVRWREGYSRSLISDFYKNVGLTSSREEQNKYAQLINPKNPESPINVYGDEATINITIKSTSFIKENVALVRYTKELNQGSSSTLSHWAATIVFQYTGTPMSEQDRAINPLGFQVIEYRNDPDQEISEKSQVRGQLPSANMPAITSGSAAIPQNSGSVMQKLEMPRQQGAVNSAVSPNTQTVPAIR